MHDVSRKYSVGLPVASMIIFVVAAIVSPQYYRTHVRRHEVGWQEQGTVLCLVPAVIVGLAVVRHRRALPTQWVTAWAVTVTAGALYFGGEECSWGQNYIGWATPDSWSAINDQHETNLHNTAGLFDHVPRALLTVAAGFCVVSPFVYRARQRRLTERNHALAWVLPTAAVVPAAALSIVVGIPQKFYGQYDKTHDAAADWFSEMFLAGRHSEMKEYFLAMFILLYLWSFATRVRQAAATKPQSGEVVPASASVARERSAA